MSEKVLIWQCPICGFRMDARQVDKTDVNPCPMCEMDRLLDALNRILAFATTDAAGLSETARVMAGIAREALEGLADDIGNNLHGGSTDPTILRSYDVCEVCGDESMQYGVLQRYGIGGLLGEVLAHPQCFVVLVSRARHLLNLVSSE